MRYLFSMLHRSANRRHARFERLENRTLLTAGVREEYLLELVNNMRTDPAAEVPLLLSSSDPSVQNALSYFQVNTTLLSQQFAALTPVAPLAYNDDLGTSALNHSLLMNQDDQQSHQLPGEADLLTRIEATGYAGSFVGENVYAYASDVFDAHAGFAIDWGSGPGGMQNPPGHRQNLMDSGFLDVGFGLVDGGGPGKSTGPLLVTEDFGARTNPGNPYLVGAVFSGTAAAPYYSISGEGTGNITSNGLANVGVTAVSTSNASLSFSTNTTTAGGYQLQLPAGNYTVTFSGGGLAAPVVQAISVGTGNVYFNVNTNQQATHNANSKYVTAVYQDVLNRAPDAAGLQFWTQLLDSGAAISSVAASIAHSPEYYANFVIKPDYLKLLGRPANAGDVTFWTGQMQNGLTDQQLEAQFVASDEFYANAGNDDKDWIDAAYKALLNRAAQTTDETFWSGQLNAGVPRGQVAILIANSSENDSQLIGADYEHYLHRAATADDLTFWIQQLDQGLTNEDVIAEFTGSQEYYNKHSS